MKWADHGQQPDTHLALMCSLFLWDGEKIEMLLVDFDNDGFIRKAKAVLESKAKRGICSLNPHWQADAMSLAGEQAHSTHNGCLVRQRQWPQTSSRPLRVLLSTTSYGLEYPGGRLGQLARPHPLPTSCPHPAFLLCVMQLEGFATVWALFSNRQNTDVLSTLF